MGEAKNGRAGKWGGPHLGRLARVCRVLCGRLKDVMIHKERLREGREMGRWEKIGDTSKGSERCCEADLKEPCKDSD